MISKKQILMGASIVLLVASAGLTLFGITQVSATWAQLTQGGLDAFGAFQWFCGPAFPLAAGIAGILTGSFGILGALSPDLIKLVRATSTVLFGVGVILSVILLFEGSLSASVFAVMGYTLVFALFTSLSLLAEREVKEAEYLAQQQENGPKKTKKGKKAKRK